MRLRETNGLRALCVCAAVVAGLWTVPAVAEPATLLDRSVRGAAVDGTMSLGEYSAGFSEGINAGFGNMIGSATDLHVDADLAGGLSFLLTGSQTACNDVDHIVIYIDSDPTAGFPTTALLTDTTDLGRAAASGGSDPSASSITFGGGFTADQAIVISNAAVSLFDLETGTHAYLGPLDRTFTGTNCDQELGSATLLTDLGLSPSDSFDYVVTLLNATDGYRSNEFHGVSSATAIPSVDAGGNPGTTPVVLGAGDFNTFESLSVLINEVDADTPGTDTLEFVELLTNHDQADLTGLTFVLYNGSNDQSYFSVDIGQNTGASTYFLLGNSAVVSSGVVFANGTLQNGPDAVALYFGPTSADFPNGTAPTDVGLVDAVVYGTSDPDATGLLSVLTPGQPQVNEDANESSQRCAGGARETTFFYQNGPTPGSVNVCPTCTTDTDCTDACQVCDTTAGLCVQAAETTPCDDGDACSTASACNADGVCEGTTFVVCDASTDTACSVNTCNPADGTCAPQDVNEGGTCDDGDLCSTGETCTAGTCGGGTAVDCSASDTTCAQATCNPADGTCTGTPIPVNNTQPCDDGDACTTGTTCVAGVCGAGTNTCSCTTTADCAAQEDGNACNGTLICVANVCVVDTTTIVTCDPSSNTACLTNTCDPADGSCNLEPDNEGDPCDDGDLCTTDQVCQAGTCSPGNITTCSPAGNTACSENTCNPATGICAPQPVNEGGSCDDGLACTTGDVCTTGTCAGAAVDCSPFNDDCNVASCDTTTGMCTVLTPTNDGGLCDDGDLCTVVDTCTGGTCGGTAVDCSTFDTACATAACDPGSGMCTDFNPANEGGTCDDSDLCTTGDVCTGGTCGGTAVDCSAAGDACNDASCNPLSGACDVLTPANGGMTCDDGDACTSGETCTGGVCTGGTSVCMCVTDADCVASEDGDLCNGTLFCDPSTNTCEVDPATVVTCDDSNDTACMANTCTPATGTCTMQPANEGGTCDDGLPCTSADVCTAGVCAGTTVDCTAFDDDCNVASCDPATGMCTDLTPTNDTGVCDDGDACTTGEVCSNGTCGGGASICACVVDADCAQFEDGNLCNGTLVCDTTTNTCIVDVATVVTCDASTDTACSVNTCNPADGTCSAQDVNEGGACTTGDLCTTGATCSAGVCGGGTTLDCSSLDDACNAGTCDPLTGACAAVPVADATACDDGSECTIGDLCTAGVCVGTPVADDEVCDDGNDCTIDDVCTAGVCAGTAADGDTACGDACNAGMCDGDGNCTATPLADGTACDDGDPCTEGDACTSGTCGGSALDCSSMDTECTVGICDATDGGCTTEPAADGTACDDGDACTGSDQCIDGLCTAGADDLCMEPGDDVMDPGADVMEPGDDTMADAGTDAGIDTGTFNNDVVLTGGGCDCRIQAGTGSRQLPVGEGLLVLLAAAGLVVRRRRRR